MGLPSSSLSSASARFTPPCAGGLPEANNSPFERIPKWSDHDMVQPSTVSSKYIIIAENISVATMGDIGGYSIGPALKATIDASFGMNECDMQPIARSPPYDCYFQPAPSPVTALPSFSPQPNLGQTEASLSYFHSGPSQHGFAGSLHGAPRRRSTHSVLIDADSTPAIVEGNNIFKIQKQGCRYPGCGKVMKDPKAHMLTHQDERPEKCPVETCKYHVKGFARKYDKNRHTLSHYKSTLVCGFCSGLEPPAEKSFNRADVFKRHLTAVHGAEPLQSSRKNSLGTSAGKKLTDYPQNSTGRCSACSQTFCSAQALCEHLDGCVKLIVLEATTAQTRNTRRPAKNGNARDVHQALENESQASTAPSIGPQETGNADDASSRTEKCSTKKRQTGIATFENYTA